MNINWFPGHMKKTEGLIKDNLKLVDIVIELVDARIPLASKNPLIDEIVKNKPRLIVFNKSDMADDKVTSDWINYYKNNGIKVVKVNSLDGKGFNDVYEGINQVLKEKIDKFKEKNLNLVIKMMVVGIPNVGKSSFINKITKRAGAKTGDRPGITKGKQWVRIKEGYELLDTPGILWHKFDDEETAKKLAFVGSIKDEILDVEELAFYLLDFLKNNYPENLKLRYNVDFNEDKDTYELMEEIGRKRGFVIKGGEIDLTRCANTILDEFRGLKLGKISLEMPKL
ncbi:MAG: ribosome biogenesis GTPase YlqF [Ruminococcaceae bacterium]|nr:ribosome biogenesis GTPase YlqF [Oscillospiraceae bacterium]